MTESFINGFASNMIYENDTGWTAVRNAPDGVTAEEALPDGFGVVSSIQQTFVSDPTLWTISRSVMQFPTSTLAGVEIGALAIEIFDNGTNAPERDAIVHILDSGSVSDSYPFPLSDYSKVGTTSFGSLHVVGPGTANWIRIPLSAAAIAALNLSGDTIFTAREANDFLNVEPPPEPSGTAARRIFWFQNDGSTPCRLVVTSPEPTPPPITAGPINRTIYCDWTGATPSSDNRNWCPDWTTPASSMCLSRRQDGSLAILFGTNDGSGRILRLDASTHNDDGEAIDCMYQTAYYGGSSGRNTYQYLTSSVAGRGDFQMSAVYPDGVTLKALTNTDLQVFPNRDREWRGIRVLSERVAWRFGTFSVDAWFKVRKLVGYARPAPWSRTLGSPP